MILFYQQQQLRLHRTEYTHSSQLPAPVALVAAPATQVQWCRSG